VTLIVPGRGGGSRHRLARALHTPFGVSLSFDDFALLVLLCDCFQGPINNPPLHHDAPEAYQDWPWLGWISSSRFGRVPAAFLLLPRANSANPPNAVQPRTKLFCVAELSSAAQRLKAVPQPGSRQPPPASFSLVRCPAPAPPSQLHRCR
jgi:hypothetical protein